VVGIAGNSVRWDFNINLPPPQFDGFGTFNSTVNQGPGETGGIAAPIVLTLEFGDLFALLANDQGASLAARVAYGDGCTAFVSNGTSTSVASDSRCGPGQQVPEASTLALLGGGLVVAGLLLARATRPHGRVTGRSRR
jgi:PEP-CTERM motif-containing protein